MAYVHKLSAKLCVEDKYGECVELAAQQPRIPLREGSVMLNVEGGVWRVGCVGRSDDLGDKWQCVVGCNM